MTDLRGEPRAKPFRLGHGERGCLLLHGFTGTPDEVRPLGELLASRGWQVSGPQLPGHGSVVEDLAKTGWRDWFAAAIEAWERLGRDCSRRSVVGLSMGSLLALHMAAKRPTEVRAVVAMAPALKLRNQAAAEQSRWLARLPLLPKRLALVPKRLSGRDTPAYDRVPVKALASLLELQTTVRSGLATVTAPCFILAGELDETIDADAANDLARGLSGAVVRQARYARSGHILTEDEDSGQVLSDVEAFLEETLPRNETFP